MFDLEKVPSPRETPVPAAMQSLRSLLWPSLTAAGLRTHELAGLPDLIAASDDEYVAIAERLLERPDLRRTYGELLQQRFQANFRPARLAQQYLDFMKSLSESRPGLKRE